MTRLQKLSKLGCCGVPTSTHESTPRGWRSLWGILVAAELCEQGILPAPESSLEEIKLSVDTDPGGKVSGDRSSMGGKSPGLPGSPG